MSYTIRSSIKSWAEDDRPREKLLLKGHTSLSDAELIAILIGTGVQNCSAVDLAKNVLALAENNLNKLGRISLKQFQEIKGIGDAKAITLIAALELGRRRQQSDALQEKIVSNSRQAYELISPNISDLPHEEFWIILLNRRNVVLRQRKISQGGLSGTVVDVRQIFQIALQEQASSIILAHNHPGGTLRPSSSDIQITHNIMKAGKILDIPVMDHIIVTPTAYYSMTEQGDM